MLNFLWHLINYLKKRFKVEVGLSDHTKGNLAITGGNHDHTYEMINMDQGTAGGSASYGRTTTTTDTGGNGSHSHGISGTTGDQGGAMGEAFDILPPFYALAYIMRGS